MNMLWTAAIVVAVAVAIVATYYAVKPQKQ